ncbi:TlpA family protein disulfide reductase [Olivibacter domesticus]|nr:thioredoxin fold domain-containing protein [Olivibacter domesticus]
MRAKYIFRPIIFIGISLGLYFCLSSLLDATILKNKSYINQPVITGLEGKEMPIFNFLSVESTTKISTGSSIFNKPIVFLYVKSGCPFCSKQLNEVRENLERLKGIQFYILISGGDKYDSIAKEFGFNKMKENVIFLVDYQKTFKNYFNVDAVPFISIYRKDQKLQNVFIGNISSEQILNLTK